MSDLKLGILIITIISPLILFISHIILIRTLNFFGIKFNLQLTLFLVMLFWNIPLLSVTFYFTKGYNLEIIISSGLYVIVVYNCFAYFYFHIFNMSDTARRIKLLISIVYHNGMKTEKDIGQDYSTNKMISNRIERLIGMKQIREIEEGKFIIGNNFLLFAANIVDLWKKILRLKTE